MDLELPSPAPNRRRSGGSFCGARTRREFLWEIGGGLGRSTLAALLGDLKDS